MLWCTYHKYSKFLLHFLSLGWKLSKVFFFLIFELSSRELCDKASMLLVLSLYYASRPWSWTCETLQSWHPLTVAGTPLAQPILQERISVHRFCRHWLAQRGLCQASEMRRGSLLSPEREWRRMRLLSEGNNQSPPPSPQNDERVGVVSESAPVFYLSWKVGVLTNPKSEFLLTVQTGRLSQTPNHAEDKC